MVVSSGGRLRQPTDVFVPGPDAEALQDANDLNRIIVDDGANGQNPDPIVFGRGGLPLSASNTLRGGDTATGIVGVLDYTWARQRRQPERVSGPAGERPRRQRQLPAGEPAPGLGPARGPARCGSRA